MHGEPRVEDAPKKASPAVHALLLHDLVCLVAAQQQMQMQMLPPREPEAKLHGYQAILSINAAAARQGKGTHPMPWHFSHPRDA
jgi:hypothetical protein